MGPGTLTSNHYIPERVLSSSGFSLVEADEGLLLANYGQVGFAWNNNGRYQPSRTSTRTSSTGMEVTGDVAVVTSESTRGRPRHRCRATTS